MRREIDAKIANNYCLPELQWRFFRVLSGFVADLLRFHRVTIPPFALSFKLLPRLGTRGESRADPLTESGHKIPSRALVASKFHIGPQQRTVTLRVCKKFEPETWSLRFVARMWFPRKGLYVSSATQQTEAGFSWKAKGQSTSGVAPRRRRGPD